MAVTFAQPALVRFGGTPVSDHNRAPLEIDHERIERRMRMADGTLRNYHVATKRRFTLQWEDLPTKDVDTVDGFMGAEGLENFFNSNTSSFTLGIVNENETVTNYTVMFDEGGFQKTISKRWASHHRWNISITLTEV